MLYDFKLVTPLPFLLLEALDIYLLNNWEFSKNCLINHTPKFQTFLLRSGYDTPNHTPRIPKSGFRSVIDHTPRVLLC